MGIMFHSAGGVHVVFEKVNKGKYALVSGDSEVSIPCEFSTVRSQKNFINKNCK